MIDQSVNSRLHYLGGGIQVMQHLPATVAASDWWNPGGTFTCVAAYQAKGAASLAASYVNLANPGTYDCTVWSGSYLAPAWTSAGGWEFGRDKVLDTGIVGANTYSWIVRYSGATQTHTGLFGLDSSPAVRLNFYPRYIEDGKTYFRAGGNYNQSVSGWSAGVAAASPVAAYFNGAYLGSVTGNYTGTTAEHIPIGSILLSGTPQPTGGATVIQGLAIYSTTLDATQNAQLSTNMAAL